MPLYQPCTSNLQALRKENLKQEAAAYVRHTFEDIHDSDSDSDSSCDDGILLDHVDMQLNNAEKEISSRRYTFCKSKYCNRLRYFNEKDCVSPDSKRFNDEEFLFTFVCVVVVSMVLSN